MPPQGIWSDMALMINGGQENMIMKGDLDMNCVQNYCGSLKEAVKHTMVNQESLFRTQVEELHRLYRVQAVLMGGHGHMEFNRSNIWRGNTSAIQSVPSMRYDAMLNEAGCSSISKVDSMLPISHKLLEERQGMYYKFHRMPFDPQLPAEQHSGHTVQSHGVGAMSSSVGLNLSLSLGNNKRKEECAKRLKFDKKSKSCSEVVIIDLEDSTERLSDVNTETPPSLGCTSSVMHFEEKHKPQVSEIFQELKEPKQQQRCVSYEARDLDLNKVFLDDVSCHSDDAMVTDPSTASSTVIERKQTKGCLNESLMNSYITDKRTEIWHCDSKLKGTSETEASLIGSSSTVIEQKQIKSCSNESLMNSCSIDKRTEIYHCDSKLKGASETEATLIGSSSTVIDQKQTKSCSNESLMNSYSTDERTEIWHCDSKLKGTNETEASLISSSQSKKAADQFSESHLLSPVTETLSTSQDHKFPSGSETGDRSINKKGDTAEADILVQIAAESLVHISMENSTCFTQDNGIGKKRTKQQAECSCDSFELIALNLTEESSDDFCVSSKAFEVDDMDNKKDFAIKLRRGRRMKDFQRDILPVIASLSRHEICEDINIMESVLRSKEYRKNKAKMGDNDSWSPPLRSRRRTRVNQSRRKRYS